MEPKPIPAFYACYLLRSTVQHASLYIGSTPNPKRRLAQHNGIAKGGAVKTSRQSLRPWEMVCLVTGFPSNIAALQFEWTWQNPHLTRRIPHEERITVREIARGSKPGNKLKRPSRPRISLKSSLANLNRLLQVPSFARWPLQVRFLNPDVYNTWKKFLEAADNAIGSDVEVLPPVTSNSDLVNHAEPLANATVATLDVTYEKYKSHLDKSTFLLADGEQSSCSVCGDKIETAKHMALVCANESCRSTSHLTCLSGRFLREEATKELIPKTGTCPDCGSKLYWVDLITELSLRIRGAKEITQLTRNRRRRKADATATSPKDEEVIEDHPDLNHGFETICVDEVLDEPPRHDAPDTYYDLDDFDDSSSVTSVASADSPTRVKATIWPKFKMPPDLTIVIEDSEYETGAEAIE